MGEKHDATPACIGSPAEEAVIGEVNTTPLIDVMLVLLILCVISIPLMDHEVPIRLPAGEPGKTQLIHHLTWTRPLACAGMEFQPPRTSCRATLSR